MSRIPGTLHRIPTKKFTGLTGNFHVVQYMVRQRIDIENRILYA